MNLNRKCEILIRSLMNNMRISDHIVRGNHNGEKFILTSGEVLGQLEIPHVGDGTPDAALDIAEHAFRAGYEAACNDVAHSRSVVSYPEERVKWAHKAWSAYDPPEEIKELS